MSDQTSVCLVGAERAPGEWEGGEVQGHMVDGSRMAKAGKAGGEGRMSEAEGNNNMLWQCYSK